MPFNGEVIADSFWLHETNLGKYSMSNKSDMNLCTLLGY